ncbi:MAG: hypothetical protein ACM3ML_17310 [Micromonosporaceae bacterium]
MNTASDTGPRFWPRRVAVLAGTTALAVTLLLGTLGTFAAGFGLNTSCTNDFDCIDTECGPCAAERAWVYAGGIGQWVLAAAAATLLVLGVRRPGWRPATTITTSALIPLAVAWFVFCVSMARRSF